MFFVGFGTPLSALCGTKVPKRENGCFMLALVNFNRISTGFTRQHSFSVAMTLYVSDDRDTWSEWDGYFPIPNREFRALGMKTSQKSLCRWKVSKI